MKNLPGRHQRVILLGLMLFLVGLVSACQTKLNNPQELVPFLKVELPGWKLAEGYPQAKRMQVKERSFLQAVSLFSSGESTITVLIKEGDIAQEVAMYQFLKKEDKTAKDPTRITRIQGFEAVEMVSKELKSAFLFILVGKKCLVTMKVTNSGDTKVLKELGKKINLRKLAALVK